MIAHDRVDVMRDQFGRPCVEIGRMRDEPAQENAGRSAATVAEGSPKVAASPSMWRAARNGSSLAEAVF
ncbi:hypothetical protein [Bradyrhizobium sp.]|uniref:hypothetical protein n=1 Tax=Bradyrhizobium sp. TaxID=376 RepID=UPI003C6FC11A